MADCAAKLPAPSQCVLGLGRDQSTESNRYYDAPRTGLVYRSAIQPPPPPRWEAAPNLPTPTPALPADEEPTNNFEEPKAQFSRLTFATFYRIAIGHAAHAFVGEYTVHPMVLPPTHPEQIACPCGRPVQTVEQAAHRRGMTSKATGHKNTTVRSSVLKASGQNVVCIYDTP